MSEYTDGPDPKYSPGNPIRDYMGESVQNTGIIPCSCMCPEHNIIYVKDPDEPEVWLHFMLEKQSFFKRIKLGIKYIFGYQSRFGMYGEMLITSANVDRLEDIVNHIRK